MSIQPDIAKTSSPAKHIERKAEVKVTEAVSSDGARVVIIGYDPSDKMVFQLIGKGFKPRETLTFVSTSAREVIYSPIQADEKGDLPAMGLAPAVIGKEGGVCHIDLLRKEDSLHLKFPWGKDGLQK